MLKVNEVLPLTEVASPLLTTYLDNDLLNRVSRNSVPASAVWLRKEGKTVAKNLSPEERKGFLKQLKRTQEFLANRRPKEKGIAILAGATTWKVFPLQLKVENELHWGKPALSQLLNLVDAERPALIVAIDSKCARFFRYGAGEIAEYESSKFHIDASQWKKKEHAHMARPGTEMPHGNQRDVFKQRMDAQYLHLCREVSKRASAVAKKGGIFSLFLVGSKRLTEPIQAALPQKLRDNVTLFAQDLAQVSVGVLQKHIDSIVMARKEQNEARRVEQLREGARGTVLGLDETLAQLQNGRISSIIVARGFDKDMKRCVKCGLASVSADPVCPACGIERHTCKLSDVLPELLQVHKTNIETTSGVAGEQLRKAGGMGGWLRPSTSSPS